MLFLSTASLGCLSSKTSKPKIELGAKQNNRGAREKLEPYFYTAYFRYRVLNSKIPNSLVQRTSQQGTL